MAAEESYVIGIGASAGGLEALKAFFDNVPEKSPHSYIIIQHLSPDYKSLMAELLSKNTSLPICEAENGMIIERSRVYLIPPKKNMTIRNNVLHLKNKPKRTDLNLPIDIFFTSLAQDKSDKAIGIILSGTGSDGTRGGRAIKEVGGLIISQDPEEAKFDGMPQSAIMAGIVDFTLPLSEISEDLHSYIEHRQKSGTNSSRIERDEETLARILKNVFDKTGKDFSLYKRPTMARRIERRMGICKCTSIYEYLSYIYEHPTEAVTLSHELLIGVTRFFRDEDVWENLEKRALRPLMELRKKKPEELRIWCIGCSTGEEVYTLSMIIQELIEEYKLNIKVKIFASDIEKKFIDIAGKGAYPESIVADIPLKLLQKYFVGKNDMYVASETIRKNIIFTQHDILNDPPFNNIDLTICRNLLIYLNSMAQQKALGVMQYALKKHGYLQLGPSESLGSLDVVFSEVTRRYKLFKNEHKSLTVGLQSLHLNNKSYKPKTPTPPQTLFKTSIIEFFNETLVEELGVTAVFIDASFNIVHAVGEIRKYIELPKTGFSMNLLKMLPDSVAASVSTAVKKVSDESEKILYKDITLEKDGIESKFDILVTSAVDQNLDFVNQIVFIPTSTKKSKTKTVKRASGSQSDDRIKELEAELKDTRDNLQATIEEVETTNEELQATNEELLAANEELQSTNEELQSVNEELYTVNAEYQQKFEDLSQLNADMDNLLSSTEIGTIFLDSNLSIRKFTPAVRKQFNLRQVDIGRPLAHFTGNITTEDCVTILHNAGKVIETTSQKSIEIQTVDKDWYLVRITPFKNSSGVTDGAVVSFIDISDIKNIEHKYHDQNIAFEQVLEGTMAGYWDWNLQDNTEYLSPYFKKMFGYEDHEMENTPQAWMKIIHPDDLQSVLDTFDDHVKSRGKIPYDNEIRYYHKNGSIVWVYCRGKVIEWDKNGKPLRMVGSHVDITSLKNEIELKKRNEELKQFAYITSHDLQEPINTMINFANLLRNDYKGKFDEDADQCLGFISDAANRMGRQIRCLLEYSRLGRQEAKEFISLNIILKNIIKDLSTIINDSGAEIECKRLPKVQAPEYDMRALFINLITNSLKFRRKEVKLKVKISCKKEKDRWVFSVEDNGIGIAKQHHEKIFLIFQRLHSQREYEGDGIGLANCKKVVEHLGGDIWVNSRIGKGTTFHFSVPLEKGSR